MEVPGRDALEGLWRLAPQPLAILAPDEDELEVTNPAWGELLGERRAGAGAGRWSDLLHPEDRLTALNTLTAVRAGTAATGEVTTRVPNPDGSWGRLTWTLRRDADTGTVLLAAAAPTPHQLQAQLQDVEARFHLAMTNAPIGMAISTLDGVWVAVNPALCKLFGYTEDDLLGGLSFADLTHPDDLPGELVLLDEMVAGTRSAYAIDKRYQRPDGSLVWTQTVVSLVRDSQGGPRYFVAQCLDTSEQHRVEEELRRAAEALQQGEEVRTAFLRSTSHELRTPLTVVMGVSQTLHRHHLQLGPERVTELLERLVANAERLGGLITELLDIDRLTSGLTTARREPVRLDRAVRAAVDGVATNGCAVHVGLTPVTLTGDVAKLERIVEHLLSNALRHAGSDGRVTITLTVADGEARLVVEDDGDGIPSGYEERIFEPFVQGPNRHDAAQPGAGLGLTWVRGFTALHHGRVQAGNRPEGGARLCVTLPVDPSDGL